jgi:hypothetical protein
MIGKGKGPGGRFLDFRTSEATKYTTKIATRKQTTNNIFVNSYFSPPLRVKLLGFKVVWVG